VYLDYNDRYTNPKVFVQISFCPGPSQFFPVNFPVLVFIAVAFGTGYVSLGSMLAGISFPLADIFIYHDRHPGKITFALVAALFLLYTHRQNIVRLWKGKENRFRGVKKT